MSKSRVTFMSEETFSIDDTPIDEEFFENAIIEYLTNNLHYEHLYGPDVQRTSTEYDDVFLPEILPGALRRINNHLAFTIIQNNCGHF